MKPKYPLVRIPTEPTRLGMFGLLFFCVTLVGIIFGSVVGYAHFRIVGAVAGGLIGGLIGSVLGSLPNGLFQEAMFRSLRRKSNDELRTMIEKGEPAIGEWTFIQAMALLNLQLRGEDVQPYRLRVIALLEADQWQTRLAAWDALRLVYTEVAVKIEDYNPRGPIEECRRQVARLRSNENPATPG
jgi:hypothetical protein